MPANCRWDLIWRLKVKRIQANQGRLQWNEIHQVFIEAVMFSYWAQTNAQAITVNTKEVCLNVKTKNTEYIIVSCEQKVQ